VDGIVCDPDHDRVVFRVSNVGDPEVWKPYQLSTGAADPSFQPTSLMTTGRLSLSIVDAQPVRNTPFTLIHWSRTDWEREERGARFTQRIDPESLRIRRGTTSCTRSRRESA